MASKYRKISTCIWNDAKFRQLSDDGKLLFFFLLSHPHMTPLGAMRATLEGIAAELKWTNERLSKAFQETTAKAMTRYDQDASCIALPNFLKHNPPQSPNVVKAWASCLDDIPECLIKNHMIQGARAISESMPIGFREAFESLPIVFRKPMPIQEQELEQETEQKQDENKSVLRTLVVGQADRPDGVEICPHKKIIALYHEVLPMCPQVHEWNDTRKGYLQRRWKEKPERQSLDFWKSFFEHVGTSKFLTGRCNGRDGAPPFVANLEWIVRPNNFAKIVEGNYHRDLP